MKYVGLDWAYRKAQWCALAPGGEIAGEGRIAADRDGLARLVLELGAEVKACLEMMSGALWVRDELASCGWPVEVADARKVRTVAPLAAKTDKVDARLLAELSRRELVPTLWLPSLDERALRERLRRRMHLVRLRTSAKGRIFGLQTQWGVRVSLARLRRADGLTLLERAGVPGEFLIVTVASQSRRESSAARWYSPAAPVRPVALRIVQTTIRVAGQGRGALCAAGLMTRPPASR
jgi:transposase